MDVYMRVASGGVFEVEIALSVDYPYLASFFPLTVF